MKLEFVTSIFTSELLKKNSKFVSSQKYASKGNGIIIAIHGFVDYYLCSFLKPKTRYYHPRLLQYSRPDLD
jgi:hypothetical protein